ncbi:MAG: ABC transporter ATP-binding protein [Bosea sp.]|uniref:ABC transporter ATP-binding protein n=1 Tax=Bosea sp. (in: a-proteobacteria) TaxID=1871050 RepID=UPI002395FFE4|nr:ABC transporter ATP-binding protein [Bosea sp. (in: a-proteobacteria)]MCP4736998.1 ABC transporter ATP-binding protein [Bosea sp. (in: a-proteobacteria)]
MSGLTLAGIVKAHGATAVLRGVSLDIREGEFLTLVGPSGCGKSTLLRLIAGLDQPDAGSLAIGGRVVDGLRPKDRDVAMVFQNYALYPHLSVFDNIAMPLRIRRLSSWQRAPLLGRLMPGRRAIEAQVRREVELTSDALDIRALLPRKPGQLSGGQRQRVALGRAMVRHPSVFLMDEPLSNLDAKLRVQMRAEITALHRRLRSTFVFVTHDQAEAMTMSDRVAVMMAGEVIQLGTPKQLYDDPGDLRVAEFIGSPKINVLPRESLAEGAGPNEAAFLAFRPEAAALCAPGTGLASGIVTTVENLGSDLFVHIEGSARGSGAPVPLVVRQPPTAPHVSPGEVTGVTADDTRLLRFDAQGRRIAPRPVATS